MIMESIVGGDYLYKSPELIQNYFVCEKVQKMNSVVYDVTKDSIYTLGKIAAELVNGNYKMVILDRMQ